MSKSVKAFQSFLRQQMAYRQGKGKQPTFPAMTAPTAAKPSPKTKLSEEAKCAVVPPSCAKQVRQVRKRIASPFPRENHVSSKQKRVIPSPEGEGKSADKRARKSSEAAAEADLNEKQLEMLAALDGAWSKIRIAFASVDGFADIREQLLSIAQE